MTLTLSLQQLRHLNYIGIKIDSVRAAQGQFRSVIQKLLQLQVLVSLARKDF